MAAKKKAASSATKKKAASAKKAAVKKPSSSVKADESQKVGDSTSRVSLKPSDAQPGVAPDSEGATTDTRGSTEGSAKGKSLPDRDEVRNRPASEQVPTAADTAAKQPIRQTDLPLGHEKQQVDGETVEVFAEPGRVDPDELPPHKRDTLLKDTLRHEGEGGRKIADAPEKTRDGGDWEPVAAERTDNDL